MITTDRATEAAAPHPAAIPLTAAELASVRTPAISGATRLLFPDTSYHNVIAPRGAVMISGSSGMTPASARVPKRPIAAMDRYAKAKLLAASVCGRLRPAFKSAKYHLNGWR